MKQTIKEAGKAIGKKFDFNKIIGGIPGLIAEAIDDSLFVGALTFVESKIPEDYKDEFELVLKAVIDDDYENLKTESLVFINSKLDIPYMDEEDEAIILNAIAKAIIDILKKKKVLADTVGGGGPGDDPTDPDEDNEG